MKIFAVSAVLLIMILISTYTKLSSVYAEELNENYPFGKIFTVKNQRISLDRIRTKKTTQGGQHQNPEVIVENKALSNTQEVSFTGYITQKDGSRLFWVDGKTELGNPAKDISVENTSSVNKFIFQVSNDRAQLKPGQVWLLGEKKVLEKYEVKKAIELPTDTEQSATLSETEKEDS